MRELKNLIEIKGDVFNISKRVKDIDKNYVIKFSPVSKKFFLMKNGKIEFTLPYSELDSRSLTYIKSNLSKSNEEILKEADNFNKKLEKISNEKIAKNFITEVESSLRRSEL